MRTVRTTRPTGDEGFALATVLGGMVALSLVVMATMGYVAKSLPRTQGGQDSAAALAAAQAGVEDYLARLATCDTYWKTPCAGSGTNAAETGWATIPYGEAAGLAQFHYTKLRTPEEESGLIRLQSTGRILRGTRPVTRTVVVDLRKESFLQYVYYTDKEAEDPSVLVSRYGPRRYQPSPSGQDVTEWYGMTPAEADKCNRYYYATATTAARSAYPTEYYRVTADRGWSWTQKSKQYSCDLQFGPTDKINGPLHTNDAILLNGSLFESPQTESSWPAGSTPAPTAGSWFRTTIGGAPPQASGFRPVYADPVLMPPSNAGIRDLADPAKGGADGCLYTGPTKIVLRTDGKMDVTSPLTRSTGALCTTRTATSPGMTTAQTVPIPKNGVVYVQGSNELCNTHPLGYGAAPDLTSYKCTAGDVFVKGPLAGKLTIAAENDINVLGDITYAGSGDVLGLIANDFVQVYHPVYCTVYVQTGGNSCPEESIANLTTIADGDHPDITINAAILSVNHSFTVQNATRGAKLGTLKVYGGIYQAYRGLVGQEGLHGYATKDYRYDARLKTLSPPFFINPLNAPWQSKGYAEVKRPSGLPS